MDGKKYWYYIKGKIMEKKEFFDVTRRAFIDYGFLVNKNSFYLDLPEVYIVADLFIQHNTYVLGYGFIIKALHNELGDPKSWKEWDSILIVKMLNQKKRWFLEYEDVTREEYEKDLKEMLSRYFDPYKNNPLDYIKKASTTIDKMINDNLILLSKRAQEFLGVK